MAYCAKCGREIMEGRQLCDLCMVEMQKNSNTVRLEPWKILSLCSLSVLILAVFLPMATISVLGYTENIPSYDDISTWLMVLLAVVGIFDVIKSRHRGIFLLSILTLCDVVYRYAKINEVARRMQLESFASVNIGIGWYILCMATIALFVASVLGRRANKKK